MPFRPALSRCFLVLLCCSHGAPAQERRDTVYALPVITVTATRNPENILEVPLAVSKISSASYAHSRLIGLDQALQLVPGVLAQSRSGAQDVRLTIRGFGARGSGDRSNAGTIRGIRVQIDGFPITEPDGRTSLDLVDLWSAGSIEVVRSNASALYGGTSGGLVDISTLDAITETAANAGTLFGTFGLRTAMAQVGVPIGSGALVAGVTSTSFDGWRDHSGQSKGQLNLSLKTPVGAKGTLGLFLAGTSNLMKLPGPLTREQMDNDPSRADSTYLARDERRFNRIARFAARWEQELAEGHAVTVQGFIEPKVLQRSERNRFRDFNRYHLGGGGTYRMSANIAEEVRSVTLVGVDEAHQDGSILFYSLAGGNRGTTLVADKEEGGNTVGFFAQEEIQIAERISLMVGGRYDILSYASDDFITPSLAATKTFTALTPALGVSYRWRPSNSFYASFGGGFEAPAFNEIDPPPPFDTQTSLNPFLEPMTSRTMEVGAKGAAKVGLIGSSLLRYDIAAYVITVRNEIVPYDGGAYFLSAGKSRRIGVEISVFLESPTGLSGGFTGTISRNRYLDYQNELGNFADKSVAGIPSAFGSAVVRYRTPFGMYADASVRYVGSYYADDANSAGASSGSSTVLDATVGGSFTLWSAVCDAYLSVANLVDTRYVASAFINGVIAPNTTTPRFFEPGLPRNIVAGLRIHFPLSD